MTPHPCPYCDTEMHRTHRAGRVQLFRCTGCDYAEGIPDDTTRQDSLPPSFLAFL